MNLRQWPQIPNRPRPNMVTGGGSLQATELVPVLKTPQSACEEPRAWGPQPQRPHGNPSLSLGVSEAEA